MVMMTNPFVKFPNQPTDNFLERLGGSTLKSPESNTTSNITWSTTGKVGWDISGTTISRTGSAGWGTSKIQSTDTFTVGDEEFMIEFSGIANDLNSTMIGFNKGTLGYYIGSPQNQNDFSIYVAGGSRVEVYESGSKNYDSGGSRNANDKFRIEVDIDGVVKYYLQEGGTGSFDLKYTSSTTASGTYFIQANAYADTSEVTVHSKTVTIPASPRIKTHFIEWFSGKTLPSYWNTTNINGSNTFAMADSVDGGFQLTTAGADSNSGTINFNNKYQYSPTGAVMISVWKKNIVNCAGVTGFKNATGAIYPTSQCAYVRNGSTSSYVELLSGAGTVTDSTDSTTATSQDFHSYKIELSSDVKLTYDGTLIITKSGVPSSALQPFTGIQKRSGSGTAILNNVYLEAYNT